jgi:2-oxoglutarate ferredoxin oxidoreductase subunit beta
MLSGLDAVCYVARGSTSNPVQIRKTKEYIKKAFEAQMRGEGFTMVEVLSPCPTNWGLEPTDAVDWLEKNMFPVFPLGVIKDTLEGGTK